MMATPLATRTSTVLISTTLFGGNVIAAQLSITGITDIEEKCVIGHAKRMVDIIWSLSNSRITGGIRAMALMAATVH